MSSLQAAAVRLANDGWPIFPCGANKRPLTEHGFKDADNDPTTANQRWGEHPHALIAMPTGPLTGFFVLDVDVSDGENGYESLDELQRQHDDLPATRTIKTRSGGRHYYFRYPATEVRNSAKQLAPGLDIRGDGGYVIVPPSPGYEVINKDDIAAAPGWLLGLIQEPARERPKPNGDGRIREGGRNDTLARMAGAMRRQGMPEAAMVAALRVVNDEQCNPPLSVKEVETIARSMGRYAPEPRSVDYVTIQDPPPVLTELSEFLEQDFPEPVQLLGPIFNENIVHVASAAGIGKTQLAVAITWQLVHGAPLWHWGCPQRTPVLFVDGEMPGRRLQDRFRLYRWAENREVLRVMNAVSWGAKHGLPHPNLADPLWQEQFLRWGEDSQVWIFDNVMSLVCVPGESMSSDQFWKPIYDFNLRARAAGKTIIWLDHVNAAGKIFGTKTKEWPADLVFTLGSDGEHSREHLSTGGGDGCVFTVVFTKTRGLFGDDAATFELKLGQDERGNAAWLHSFTEDGEVVTACMLREKGLSQREIADRMGKSVGKINKLLRQADSE